VGTHEAVPLAPEGSPPGEIEPGEAEGPAARLEQEKDDGQWVTVLLFAGAREAAGTGRARARADGRTVTELLDELVSAYGTELEAVLATCAIWVNGSPATGSTRLVHRDEVAVLPPVSGGCGTLDFDVLERRRSV
jgi:molybdopterin converting factor small subunit